MADAHGEAVVAPRCRGDRVEDVLGDVGDGGAHLAHEMCVAAVAQVVERRP